MCMKLILYYTYIMHCLFAIFDNDLAGKYWVIILFKINECCLQGTAEAGRLDWVSD